MKNFQGEKLKYNDTQSPYRIDQNISPISNAVADGENLVSTLSCSLYYAYREQSILFSNKYRGESIAIPKGRKPKL